MAVSQFENVCFILDASRSSARTDLSPSRLDACKQSILEFIQRRRILDSEIQTFYALVVVGREIQTIFRFGDYPHQESFETEMENITPGGSSNIAEGIGIALKLHIEDIRASGTRTPRIIIIGDGNITQSPHTTPEKMANIAAGLGIKIDAVKIGGLNHSQALHNIAQITTGKLYEAYKNSDLTKTMEEIARQLPGNSYIKPKNFSKLLEKIAVPLKSEAEMKQGSAEIVARIRNQNNYNKCGICFNIRDPVKKLDFSLSGRYCPNCGTGFHLHCINEWAESHSEGRSVVRCPHCFYLIKIPTEIQQTALLHEEYKKERTNGKPAVEIQGYKVNINTANKLGDAAVYSSCPVCNTIFNDDEKVTICGNPYCSTIYHEKCFDSVANRPCKVCGKTLLIK
ncbi:MAG: VWA domain-containing protein [Candidatus Lokiarchaeota archaeon]|nr:VWA domain-containing protein [Candidatus Lokiarchaeota archaeon]